MSSELEDACGGMRLLGTTYTKELLEVIEGTKNGTLAPNEAKIEIEGVYFQHNKAITPKVVSWLLIRGLNIEVVESNPTLLHFDPENERFTMSPQPAECKLTGSIHGHLSVQPGFEKVSNEINPKCSAYHSYIYHDLQDPAPEVTINIDW